MALHNVSRNKTPGRAGGVCSPRPRRQHAPAKGQRVGDLSVPPAIRRAASSTAVRCCATRLLAVKESAGAPKSPAGCPGGHQPRGNDAQRRGALNVAAERREKVAVRAGRALGNVHGPRVAARRCQSGQPKARRVEEPRLFSPRRPRVYANPRYHS